LRTSGSPSAQSSAKKPEIPKARGRSFQITAEEAIKTADVVTGTFLLNSLPAYVLFDSGANRSFVSVKFASHSSFELSKLPVPVEVEVANSKTFLVFEIFRGCKLTVKEEEYPIDLIPMTLGEFDVIIGMDWLSKYQADIGCYHRRILLRSPRGHKVVI